MKYIKILCAWIPAVLMMIIIFRFSASYGEQSAGLSFPLTGKIMDTVTGVLNMELTPEEELYFSEAIHTPIRKLGHLAEYGMLAVTVAFPLYMYHHNRRWSLILWCEGICIFYAGTDEFHQLFVPERSGQFMDVLIDGIGGFAGILFFRIIIILIYKFQKSKTDKLTKESV